MILPMAYALTGSEVVIRELPSEVGVGQTFVMVYEVQNIGTDWAVFIEDTVTSQCIYGIGDAQSSGDSYSFNAVWTSDEPKRKLVEVTAQSGGVCVFSGTYLIVDNIENTTETPFAEQSVSVTGACVSSIEVCDGVDNDCDGEIDEGGICTCTEAWSCTDWGDCVDGIEARQCTDGNNCPTDFDKPAETQDCGEAKDFCQYFEWAKGISEDDYCIAGIGIVFGVLFVFIYLMKK